MGALREVTRKATRNPGSCPSLQEILISEDLSSKAASPLAYGLGQATVPPYDLFALSVGFSFETGSLPR